MTCARWGLGTGLQQDGICIVIWSPQINVNISVEFWPPRSCKCFWPISLSSSCFVLALKTWHCAPGLLVLCMCVWHGVTWCGWHGVCDVMWVGAGRRQIKNSLVFVSLLISHIRTSTHTQISISLKFYQDLQKHGAEGVSWAGIPVYQ